MMAVWRLKGEATQGLQKESPTFLVKILFTLVGKNRQTNQRISHTTKRIRKNCAVKFYRCSRIILKNIERTIYLKSTRLKLNSNRKNRIWVWVKIIKKKARNQKGRTKYTAEGRSNCRKSSTAPPKSKGTSQLSTCPTTFALKEVASQNRGSLPPPKEVQVTTEGDNLDAQTDISNQYG